MKTYKIFYTIVDGESHYGDHIEVQADQMTLERGARELANAWVPECYRNQREAFAQELIDEGSAMIPGDERALKKWDWTEVKPIIVTVRQGMVIHIANIPGDVSVEVHDFDTEIGVPTDPIPFITRWV